MELLLWRWSTIVQATSNLIIAVFFIALALSLRRRELHAWLGAWLFNLGALGVTITYWIVRPESSWGRTLAGIGYTFCKTMFVLLLIVGVSNFLARPARRNVYLKMTVIAAVFAIVVAYASRSLQALGLLQESMIALGFGAGTLYLLTQSGRFAWVTVGFGMRAALSLVSIYAYGSQIWSTPPTPGSALSIFVSAHSSFDAGAEWIIALGCLLTTYRLIQHELTTSNVELRTAQRKMQQLLERDQLTGVFNRRALPAMFDEARKTGATVLFFDLDDFKKINDVQGHHAGDASLTRFARALQESFRTGDRVIRYAGDEFVVVAQDMDLGAIETRVRNVREKVRLADADVPALRFSVGRAVLHPDGDPDHALREADQAMYDAKAEGRSELGLKPNEA
ncbi:GGDEF domain-containing protein [Oleiagrimonas soli]|uniref:diguanylate cyclase n=1 Tax=Oleiagrimonas soli TaxID=1543381 RepID=A0A841KJL5_9GAMM|nr:GGDEF domain-containing protein [Oleiagrimonas soli]MBB6182821.1 diguanylate cyclase (GGDEF)-like protein [Oleiagrimonas soli]